MNHWLSQNRYKTATTVKKTGRINYNKWNNTNYSQCTYKKIFNDVPLQVII